MQNGGEEGGIEREYLITSKGVGNWVLLKYEGGEEGFSGGRGDGKRVFYKKGL